jgi:hypothetical protein
MIPPGARTISGEAQQNGVPLHAEFPGSYGKCCIPVDPQFPGTQTTKCVLLNAQFPGIYAKRSVPVQAQFPGSHGSRCVFVHAQLPGTHEHFGSMYTHILQERTQKRRHCELTIYRFARNMVRTCARTICRGERQVVPACARTISRDERKNQRPSAPKFCMDAQRKASLCTLNFQGRMDNAASLYT